MKLFGALFFYGIVGTVVAIAMSLLQQKVQWWQRLPQFLLWCLFWPFFAPLLLARPTSSKGASQALPPSSKSRTGVDATKQRLLSALSQQSGVAEEVLVSEKERVHELASSLVAMEDRLHEMEALLATPEFSESRVEFALEELTERGIEGNDTRISSIRARLRNIKQLKNMRDNSKEGLERALYKMEEISSQLLLLRFANQAESQVVEKIKSVAAAVEGVSESLSMTQSSFWSEATNEEAM